MRTRCGWMILACGFSAGLAAAETIERIVAKVNGRIITLAALEQEVQMTVERLGPAPSAEEEEKRTKELRSQILERLIDNLLVLQVAEERGLRVPARFFEEWKKKIMEEMKIDSDQEFVRQVELQGQTIEGLKKGFEEGLLLQEVRRMEVDSKVSVSEPEIQERYRQHIAEYTEPARVRIREIVVKFDQTTEVDQGAKTRRLLQDIRQGADFAEVARMHSESSSREAGGDLGFFNKGELTDKLDQTAFALEPGQVSEIIRLDAAFYILKVEEKVPEKIKTMDEVRKEVADAIFEEKLSVQMDRYVKGLRERAIVEIKL